MMQKSTQFIGCLIVFLLSGTGPVWSLDLKISLHNDKMLQSVLISIVEGDYEVSGEGMEAVSSYPGDSWYILNQDGELHVRDMHDTWYSLKDIRFETTDETSVFSLKPGEPVLESRDYRGGLEANVSMKSLRLINNIDLDTYVMGVTETEAGPSCPLEYYKVQAILCRTFALKNMERHWEEGFNLCDGVHCQSYKGMHIWNEDVEIGTEVTSGLVICEEDSSIINPVYHSNSGGETQGAEKVWLKGEPYLKPVLDPFSEGKMNSVWERNMQVRDWIYYLMSYDITFPEDADTTALEMRQNHRREYYKVLEDSIHVSSIREDFSYRSDFFDVLVDGEMIRIKGRGYGHGVGLSQEGAIEMAGRRYHYTSILNYYYHKVLILPYFGLKELFSQQ